LAYVGEKKSWVQKKLKRGRIEYEYFVIEIGFWREEIPKILMRGELKRLE
jgi:hypothetical protein